MAFEVATRKAYKLGLAKAKPVLLEPMMKVEVTDTIRLSRLRHRRPE